MYKYFRLLRKVKALVALTYLYLEKEWMQRVKDLTVNNFWIGNLQKLKLNKKLPRISTMVSTKYSPLWKSVTLLFSQIRRTRKHWSIRRNEYSEQENKFSLKMKMKMVFSKFKIIVGSKFWLHIVTKYVRIKLPDL